MDIGLLDFKKEQVQKKFLVYPNPSWSIVNIESAYSITGIQIYDSAGKLILNKAVNNKQTVINTEAFAVGTYHIVLDTEKGRITRTIIKENSQKRGCSKITCNLLITKKKHL